MDLIWVVLTKKSILVGLVQSITNCQERNARERNIIEFIQVVHTQVKENI
jgi:hypothetical protein